MDLLAQYGTTLRGRALELYNRHSGKPVGPEWHLATVCTIQAEMERIENVTQGFKDELDHQNMGVELFRERLDALEAEMKQLVLAVTNRLQETRSDLDKTLTDMQATFIRKQVGDAITDADADATQTAQAGMIRSLQDELRMSHSAQQALTERVVAMEESIASLEFKTGMD